MEEAVWLLFLGSSFIFCMVPGPSVCFTVAHSIQYGTSRTNITILGQLTGNALYITLVCFGLGSLIEDSIHIFHAVKYIGAVYIILLGIKQLFSKEFPIEFEIATGTKSKAKSFFDGFVVCGTNPKTFFYYAAFLPQFIIPQYDKQTQLIFLGLGSMVVAGTALLIYNFTGKRAKYYLLKKNFFSFSNKIIGALLIIAGVSLGFL